ncbi:MAG: TIGR00366 family protein [Negativicutes bacterium]|nr:TIGR00366 family protein [Negativicutes bacterium]
MSTPQVSVPQHERSAIAKFIAWFSQWSIRWIPDSMVFVLVLTIIAYLMALSLTKHGPIQLIDDWVKGFWVLLTFAMQMCVLMITGFAVADSKPVKNAIRKLVDIPQTRNGTMLMFLYVSLVVWWAHWGIGLMLSIVMAREIAVRKRGLGIHYPSLCAMSYCGILVCNGPSQAAQLLVATPGHFLEKVTGVIPLTATVFEPHLLITVLLIVLTLPPILLAAMPRKEHAVEATDEMVKLFSAGDPEDNPTKELTQAEKWDRSPVLVLIIGLAGLAWVINFIWTQGIGKLDLNTLNFTFLVLGLLLHRTPRSFVGSVQRGTSTVHGVIIQFPLYAGIFGMISYSGLAEIIAKWFVAISTAHTFPWIVYIYSGILDMFVPSAGSKFVIEAPYIIPAARELGANIPYVINAYTFGSICFNLIQPFWALPIMGAFKLGFQEILPYSFLASIWGFIVISFGLLVLPLLF